MQEELDREYASERERNRARKKRAGIEEFIATRRQFFDGDFDAYVHILTKVQLSRVPTNRTLFCIALRRISPARQMSLCMTPSCRHVLLCSQQPLVECQARLRANHSYINVSVTEPWLRRYQVLPARTHPDMTTSATGGFILHAIRVLGEDEATDRGVNSPHS